MTFYEAIRWLGKKYGIEVEEKKMNEEERQQQTDREGMFNLNEFAQKCFEDDLFNTPEGRNIGLAYFRERGIQDATIHRYHLGYALEAKDNFARRALERGHKREYLPPSFSIGQVHRFRRTYPPACRSCFQEVRQFTRIGYLSQVGPTLRFVRSQERNGKAGPLLRSRR